MQGEKIKFVDENGVEKEAEVVLCLSANDKKYAIYTLNETDENGNIALYSSIINEDEEGITLDNIESEDEWAMIKEAMKKIVVDWKEGE